ncbi:hypothetical protein GALMADRAFT_159230 [Galerina marginata CBS 339.88]|uniref:HNH domain-containing protein n=1 Tax=Galerina marginata (strain CBS 339.88) TaxID=685588 RepID=A0A067SLQ7_GALM3|nr:hypothetical protein GALMADRAFT_159230 [Galerina marginata CBS 339.88]
MEQFEQPQFSTFKDCIAQKLLHHTAGTKEAQNAVESDGLDEFASYLAMEAWPTVPTIVKEATFETRESVPDIDSISLDSISVAFVESLISYDIVPDADDALKFLEKALGDYLAHACSPPPVWKSTRTNECAICSREVPLTYHHLIPRSTHAKVLKKGWHPKSMLNSVSWLCRPCHSAVHSVARGEELAQHFYTVELLLQREDIQKWQKYAAKQRFGVRRG